MKTQSKSPTFIKYREVRRKLSQLEETLNHWYNRGFRPIHIDTSDTQTIIIVFEDTNLP